MPKAKKEVKEKEPKDPLKNLKKEYADKAKDYERQEREAVLAGKDQDAFAFRSLKEHFRKLAGIEQEDK